MTTSVIIENVRFRARHGVAEQERLVGNDFEVSLRLDYPFEEAMESDDLEATLNYAEIYEVVKWEMDQPSKLLEHVAGRIRKSLMEAFPAITGGTLRIVKLKAPIPGFTGRAAVEVSW